LTTDEKKFDPNSAAEHGGIFGLPCGPDDSKVVLIPVPWELTTSYGKGASLGPEAIKQASMQVDLHDLAFGDIYKAGIYLAPVDGAMKEACDYANFLRHEIQREDRAHPSMAQLADANRIGDELNQMVSRQVAEWRAKGKLVGLIGGEHSVSYGAIKAHAEAIPNLGVLHIDAHADLRIAYEGFTWSHASVMRNAMDRLTVRRLVQIGVRDYCEQEAEAIRTDTRIITHFDEDIANKMARGEQWEALCHKMLDALPENVYISFDIDGLDPTLCPHTGTPVPGGLSFRDIEVLLRVVSEKCHVVGFDLVEVAPGRDDEWDANVGARVLYKLIGCMLASQTNAR